MYDHDFPTLADGIVIPHGLYDLVQNIGYVVLGTSHDTSECACDCLIHWGEHHGTQAYPHAPSLLVICDGGGSNNARYYIFKDMLQRAAQVLGIEIRIAHYPPYTSKYNPIEHRLFPHLTRACQGVIFTSVELVRELMSKASTRTGLQVHVAILDAIYQTGKKVADDFKTTMRIVFVPTFLNGIMSHHPCKRENWGL